MMMDKYLQITFRKGRLLAAYLYFPRSPDQKSHATRQAGAGLLIDLDAEGSPIGIEITAPETITLAALNEVLFEYCLPEVTQEDIAPLVGVASRRQERRGGGAPPISL